jgi:outer membrane protein assembly factor BamB
MARALNIWRSWDAWQRGAAISIAVLAAGVAAFGIVIALRRPADVSHPQATFKPKEPEVKHVKATNWPEYGFDDQRTRYLPTKRVIPPFGARDWEFRAPALLEFSPVYARGHLYLIDKNATFYSLQAHNGGHVDWKRDLGNLSASSPAYHGGRVFAVTLSPGQVIGMRASDGKVLWRHDLPGRSESSPLVHGGRVFVGCESGDVFAFDEKTGKLDWKFHSGGAVKGGVAYDHGAVFFGNYAGQVYAVDASSGGVHWQAATQGGGFLRGGGIYSTPAIAFGRVYFGGLDGRVYSYVEKTGELAWSQSTGAEVYPAPAVAAVPGTAPSVFVGSQDHHFYAMNARTGKIRWQKDLGGVVLGAASVIGRDVYAAVIGPNVGTYGFRVSDGKKQFYSDIGEYNPVISDNKHLFLTGANLLIQLPPRQAHVPKNQRPKKGKKAKRDDQGKAQGAKHTTGGGNKHKGSGKKQHKPAPKHLRKQQKKQN